MENRGRPPAAKFFRCNTVRPTAGAPASGRRTVNDERSPLRAPANDVICKRPKAGRGGTLGSVESQPAGVSQGPILRVGPARALDPLRCTHPSRGHSRSRRGCGEMTTAAAPRCLHRERRDRQPLRWASSLRCTCRDLPSVKRNLTAKSLPQTKLQSRLGRNSSCRAMRALGGGANG